MKELLFFYGQECEHCKKMDKLVMKLVDEGFTINKLEIWHNENNMKMMENIDVGEDACGGVPFFLNQKSGKTLCGEVTYKEMKEWAES